MIWIKPVPRCPLCGAKRTRYEARVAECYTCGRDTWEDHGGVNQFEIFKQRIVEAINKGQL